MSLLRIVKATIRRYSMLKGHERIVVAVSGGVDSMVLLHVLLTLSAEYPIELCVAHVNHSLRGEESDRDELFVKEVADRYGLPFFLRKLSRDELKVGGESLQSIARIKRYGFLEEVRDEFNADVVALGHHRDDQVETVLMRLFMGSGIPGLKGMLPVRGVFIRPLFDVKRHDILRYAEEQGIGYVSDRTNKDLRYLRNRIRLRVIPFLESEIHRSISDRIFNLSKILIEEDDFLEAEAEKRLDGVVLERSDDEISLDIRALTRLHRAIQTRILRMVWEGLSGDRFGLYSYHISAILDILDSASPNLRLNLPRSIKVFKEYDRLVFIKGSSHATDYNYILNIPGITDIKETGDRFRSEIIYIEEFKGFDRGDRTVYFDLDRLKLPVRIRRFIPGDRIAPLGIEGSKKVKELFIEKRIPLRRRRMLPILVSGDDIIWIPGVRRSSHALIDKDTKRVLKVELKA